MDKDLKSAIVYENCGCYDRALDAAIKVLENNAPESDNALWSKKIVKSLGEQFLKQRFMDKAMECFKVLTEYPAPEEERAKAEPECVPDDSETTAYSELGPNTVTLTTKVSQDIYDLFKALEAEECNASKDEAELLREGVFLLILKYATEKKLRGLLFEKLQSVILK
jgi:tetratricopeptide (TPR) repeat protein